MSELTKNFKENFKTFIDNCFSDGKFDILFFIGISLLLLWMPISYGGRYLNTQTAGQIITGSLILVLLRQKNKNIFKYPLWAISMFWLGILSLSTFLSVAKLASIEELMRNLMYISLSIIIFSWVDIKDKTKLLSYSILSSGFIVSLFAIISFFINYYNTLTFELASSPFGRTNDLGAYMLLIFSLALSNFLYENDEYLEKAFYALVSIFSSFTIVLTFSRGIWLSAVISLALILILGRKILKRNLIYLGIVGIIGLIPIIINWEAIVTRFLSIQNIFNNAENSIEWRKSLIESTFNIFLDNPVIGTGLNSFPFVFSYYQQKAGYYSINPHNYYLQLLAETGVMGFFSFMILVLSILYMSFKAFKNSENIFRGIALGLLVGILSSLIHISVDIDWSVLSIPMVFWIEVGLLIAIYHSVNFKETRFTEINNRFDYIKKYVIIFSSITLIIVPTMNYLSLSKFTEALEAMNNGDFENAKKYNEKAMLFAPYSSSKHNNNYALLLTKEKNYSEALKYNEKAISLDRYNYNFYKLNSDLILKTNPNNKEEALESLKNAVLYNPYAHPKLYKQVGDFYINKLNNLDEGIKWYIQGIERFPLEQVNHYERYTPDDRFQLYRLYKDLAIVLDKTQIGKGKDYKKVSELILASQPKLPDVNEENSTPTNVIKSYWKNVYKKDISHLVEKDSKIFPPPQGFDYKFVDFVNIENTIFKVKIEYKIQLINDKQTIDLIIIDELIQDNNGWVISDRYKKENEDI
ncbi:MAG: O-antigen ligase family protein [Candidatus Sericytochromatia bacterium]